MEEPTVAVEQTGAEQERMIPLSAVAPLLGLLRRRYKEIGRQFRVYTSQVPTLKADLFEMHTYDIAAAVVGMENSYVLIGGDVALDREIRRLSDDVLKSLPASEVLPSTEHATASATGL